jgi:serine/threonine-protein kinase
VLGTPAYMAPELAAGNSREADRTADVYSLGAILYEALTGRPPFQGSTREAILEQVVRRAPAEPRTIVRTVSPKLEAVCLKCLSKSPARRYSTAQALADDLNAFLAGQPQQAKPPGWAGQAYRIARRRAMAAGLASMVPAAVFARRALDPDRPVQRMQQQLADGETVSLIGKAGGPRWQRFIAGASRTQTSLAADGTFSLHSWSTCLLELLPGVPTDQFRLSVEICHHSSDIGGEVGLYFARTASDDGPQPIQLFMQLAYNDVRSIADVFPNIQSLRSFQRPKGNCANLQLRLYSQADDIEKASTFLSEAQGPLFQHNGNGGRWRTLEIILSNKQVHAKWDDEPLDILCKQDAQQKIDLEYRRLSTTLAMQGSAHPRDLVGFLFDAGFGLYISRGSASFRSFTASCL